jgi:hypothetical protein
MVRITMAFATVLLALTAAGVQYDLLDNKPTFQRLR